MLIDSKQKHTMYHKTHNTNQNTRYDESDAFHNLWKRYRDDERYFMLTDAILDYELYDDIKAFNARSSTSFDDLLIVHESAFD